MKETGDMSEWFLAVCQKYGDRMIHTADSDGRKVLFIRVELFINMRRKPRDGRRFGMTGVSKPRTPRTACQAGRDITRCVVSAWIYDDAAIRRPTESVEHHLPMRTARTGEIAALLDVIGYRFNRLPISAG